MQHHQNNDIRKIPEEKGKGLAGTIIIHIVLLLVLFFIAFKVPAPPEIEEGIMVNFGTDETGFGMIEPPTMQASAAAIPLSGSETVNASEEALLTQNDEEAPEVREVDPETERIKREQAEADRKRRAEREAAERQRREEEARIRAEQQQTETYSSRTRDAFAASQNAAANSADEGTTMGRGNQGDPTGSPDSGVRGNGGNSGNGVSYDLGGRRHTGQLPSPIYNRQSEGKVVVQIRVDGEGNVTYARGGVQGTIGITDDNLIKAAEAAARNTKFVPSTEGVQVGTITYNFVLN